jgi:hypothetical protein
MEPNFMERPRWGSTSGAAESNRGDGGEAYFINKAKAIQETDPFQAKSLILTARSLYPGNFNIQVSGL